MAKRRISQLSDQDRERLNLFSLILETNFGMTEFLRDIQRTGKVPSYVYNPGILRVISPEILKSVEDIAAKLPMGTRDIEIEAQKKPELEKLTDEELVQRKEILEDAEKSEREIDRGTIERELKARLQAFNVNQPDQWANRLANLVIELGRYPSKEEFETKFGARRTPLGNFFGDQDTYNYFSNIVSTLKKIPVTAGETQAITDLLSGREVKRTKDKEIEDFLSSLPTELAGSREPFLESLRAGGRKEYERAESDIAQTANIYGGLYSGDVGDLLSTSALGIQSRIDAITAELEFQDNKFYFDAGYKNQIRKTLESSENVRESIASEREKFLGEQQYRFNVAQGQISSFAEEGSVRRNYEQQLRSQEARLKRQRDMGRERSRNDLFSGLGRAGGAVVGGLISQGNPYGIAIGSELGGALTG